MNSVAVTPALKVSDLTVAYDEKPALWDLDLEVPQGAAMAIVGPNGAGKSTLLKAVLGLVKPAAGTIELFGAAGDPDRRRVAYVPQRESVDWDFPINVLDVVLMGRFGHLGWLRRPGRDDNRRARAALEDVGMSEYANRHIAELSGGQQQRVFLARALAQDASLFVLDEPFQGIDAVSERTIADLFARIQLRGGTVLAVHHDLGTVAEYFDHVLVLNVSRIAAGTVAAEFTNANLGLAYGVLNPLLADAD
jgi:manganese/zinc/iron transport system ATP- binding protein